MKKLNRQTDNPTLNNQDNQVKQVKQDNQVKSNVHRRDHCVIPCHVVGIDVDIYHAMLQTKTETKIPHHVLIIIM
jgi:hypothetical protein